MKLILVLLAGTLIAQARSMPEVMAAKEVISDGIAKSLICNGITFYSNKLYVSSERGLLEVEKGNFTKLLRWDKDDSNIEGPWTDTANGLLWVLLPSKRALSYFDGNEWQIVRLPKPRHGYISANDMWRGFRGVSGSNTFWLEGAGRAWTWNHSNGSAWVEEKFPTEFGVNLIPSPLLKRMIPCEGRIYYIVRDQKEPLAGMEELAQTFNVYDKLKGDTVYCRIGNSWICLTNYCTNFFSVETVEANKKGYVRTKAGDLLELSGKGIFKVAAPGLCEAIAKSSEGNLLASFRGMGIYELGNDWKRLLQSPYDDLEQRASIHVAVGQQGQIALTATLLGSAKANSKQWVFQGGNPEFRSRAPAKELENEVTRIWVSDGLRWTKVSIY